VTVTVGIYVVKDNRESANEVGNKVDKSENVLKAKFKKLKSEFKKLKSGVKGIGDRVEGLEQRVMASGNGVYSLMQAAVGNKTLVKEMVAMVEKCQEPGGKDC